MDLGEKLPILAGSAKYDASCASSGSGRRKGFGANLPEGVCHSWTEDGRCVSLLKVLYSNVCRYDCAYCVNRASADIVRTAFTVQELVELTCEFYRRNYIEGLFLSSGIFSDPDIVMERLIKVARTLRTEAGYGGYIHLKIIPGSGQKLVREAGIWADRLSVNIELPTDRSLKSLAPQKSGGEILGAMNDFSHFADEAEKTRAKSGLYGRRSPATADFAPAGQSTQLIVGATEEDDRQIVNLSSSLYRKFSLKRVYYSAFVHPKSHFTSGSGGSIPGDSRLPELPSPPLLREHRLYQADWLLRFYRFGAEEILGEDQPFLDRHVDPKTAWALRHLDFFPVEINRADYETLLRVPGIGAKTARRIVETRRSRSIGFDGLRRIGAVLKRAKFFATCAGRFLERADDPHRIRRLLSDDAMDSLQPELFDSVAERPPSYG